MDKLLKGRRPFRTKVTKLIGEIVTALDVQPPDTNAVQVLAQMLEDSFVKVQQWDQQIAELMVEENASDNDQDKEFQGVADYEKKYRTTKIAVDKVLYPSCIPASNASPPASEHSCATGVGGRKHLVKLPKIQLRKFNGDLTEWLGFWAQFEKIHEDDDIAVPDKFQYLVQAMVPGSRAQEVVCSYPQSVDNYAKAIAALKQRFGKEELLVKVYVRELLKLVINNITQGEKQCVSKMFDKLETQLRSLESLGVTSDKYASMLYPLVESSLPEDNLRAWQRSPLSAKDGTKKDPPKSRLSYLMEFLRNEVESEDRIALAKDGFGMKKPVDSKPDADVQEKIPTAAGLLAGDVKKISCLFCEGSHESPLCIKAKGMSVDDRREKVKTSKACFTCLKRGHGAAKCKLRLKCLMCSKKHYELLCPELSTQKAKQASSKVCGGSDDNNKSPKGAQDFSNAQSTITNLVCTRGILLCTQLVKIVYCGKEHVVRALYDSGGQRSYIQTSTATSLNLTPCGSEVLAQQLFGGKTSKPLKHNKYNITLRGLDSDLSVKAEVLDQTRICGDIPRMTEGPWLQELVGKGIKINDHGSECPQIELLIGADLWGKLLTARVEQLSCGLTAIETVFGWTVMGKLNLATDHSAAMLVTSLLVGEARLPDLWKLEVIGIKDPIEVQSQEERDREVCLQFAKSACINQDGRYEVGLPWILGHDRLPDNFDMARKRLETSTKRLNTLKLFEQYHRIFIERREEGIIEDVAVEELNAVAHYLPHRPVVRPDSKTTPVRPVFDASCKSPGSPSLNDCLEKGPNLIELLPSILLRFREHRFGHIADIKKAFLMISVRKEDRDSLRFLWWENGETEQVKVYRHCRVVFGVNCSPFLLGAVIQHHLEKVSEEDVVYAAKLRKSLYVDNCVTSAATVEEIDVFQEKATHLLAQIKLELRLWEDNVHCNTATNLTPVLGLNWNRADDTLSCQVNVEVPEVVTKRAILSAAQQIFDPLGVLCPVLLMPKLLLQDTWALKMGWDVELPEDIKSRFYKWVKELDVLLAVKIPRWMSGGYSSRDMWSLHTFCDASKLSYAAAVYLRCLTDSGVVSVQLLQAKTRVAPLKRATIPRLELLACTIGSRLARTVKDALGMADISSLYWSDSTTAITWIKRNSNWGVFVANRVREILLLTKSEEWRHIPGVANPADLPSRGCSPKQLLISRWWEGPQWMRQEPGEWPLEDIAIDEAAVASERRKVTATLVQGQKERPWYMRRFSEYSTIVRLVAWINRWPSRKGQGQMLHHIPEELSVQELRQAEITLMGMVQREAFVNVKALCNFNVTKDKEGIIRVRSKITRRNDLHDFRYPMLLPSKHPLVDSLIRETHLKNCHAGIQVIMTKLREKFWIIHSRKVIRGVLGKCQRCQRYEGRAMQTEPTPLPVNRVKDASVFEVSGIDLAGPLYLKDSSKVWIVLFTCAVYRAVHLELVSSLSTEGFLQALRRFIARRGRPSVIYTDNGTNFTGTDNAFRMLDWKHIEAVYMVDQIHWHFNPPTAAWWGGWWERLVRMVKNLLLRTLGKAILHYEEMCTVLCDVEATVNARPLTYLAEDPDDLSLLTPAMFLRDIPSGAVPDIDKVEKAGLERRFRYRQRLMHDLRIRFREEYLGQLVQRGREKKVPPIKVGDVVLISIDNRKRLDWPLGRVIDLYPGQDGHVRVVRVKTAGGELLRPVQKLHRLEVDAEEARAYTALPSSVPIVQPLLVQPDDTQPMVVTKTGRVVKPPKRFGYD